jgi:hypothetical protein
VAHALTNAKENIMCSIILTLALASIDCPAPRPTAVEAARILEIAPGLSNRTHVYTPSILDRRGSNVVVISTPATSKPVERESDTARAIRMGIPGGWTPLEFAILNGGRK